MKRRTFAAGLAAGVASAAAGGARAAGAVPQPVRPAGGPGSGAEPPAAVAPTPTERAAPVLPGRLRPGDTVGLVTPATAAFQQVDLDIARESLEALGLRVRVGRHARDRHGSLGGRDEDRAADLNECFADPEIRAVLPVRGGWGSARLLPLLDYAAIRRDPKILLGYSDITALLNGIHARTGLVTFHGPNAGGRWDAYSVAVMRRVLFEAERVTLDNPRATSERNVLTATEHRIRTITPGRAEGPLLGGNLTVLTALLGSPWFPDCSGAILFLEDVGEDWYRVDRMMTSLKLAGVLDRIAGFVFGTCSECEPGEGFASLTPEEIFADHIAPLGIPAWQGAMIGHDQAQWTLPVGAPVAIDASRGTVALRSAGVT